MAFTPGHPKIAGRTRGTPNRSTQNAREAIARFVDGNADRLQTWLDEIAEQDGPKAAFDAFMALVEFHVPKLVRTELRAVPEYAGPTIVITDPTEAADAYSRIVRGELPADAVAFDSAAPALASSAQQASAQGPTEHRACTTPVGQAEDPRLAPRPSEVLDTWSKL